MASFAQKLFGNFMLEEKSSWNHAFLRNLEWTFEEDILKDPYARSDLVYSIVSTTARAISQVPLVVYEEKGTEDEFEPVRTDHPWQMLINSPNPLMSYSKFITAVVSFYLLQGDVFVVPWPLEFNVGSLPSSLYVVAKRNMEPKKDPETGQLANWMYKPHGTDKGKVLVPVEKVVHYSTWSPSDSIMGQAPTQAVSTRIKSDYKASVYNEQFFDNAAIPAGIIRAPKDAKISDPQEEKFREMIETTHKGYKRAFKLLFLRKGLEYQAMASTHKDMDFMNLTKNAGERVMQALGMKKAVLSVLEDVNLATAKEQKKSWWEDTNGPIMSMIADGLNHTFIAPKKIPGDSSSRAQQSPRRRLYCAFDTSNVSALKEDFTEKVDSAHKLWQMGLPINAINQKLELGFDEVSWGDVWWTQSSMVPIFDAEPRSPTPPTVDDDDDDDNKPDKPPTPSAPEPPVEEDVYTVGSVVGSGGKKDNSVPLVQQQQQSKYEIMWKTIVSKSFSIEDNFRKKVQRNFYDMRKRALRHLLKDSNVQGLINETFDEERMNLQRWTARLYSEAIRIGMQTVNDLLEEAEEELEEVRAVMGMDFKGNVSEMFKVDIDFEMTADPEIIGYIGSRIGGITGINETVVRRIRNQIAEGFSGGESLDQLADRIKNEFRMATSRAKTIARTETFGALNKGRSHALEKSGFTEKQWFTAMDERVRDSHDKMNNEKIGVNEKWLLAGGEVSFPGDPSGPAGEVINCRCTEVPVIESHPAFLSPSSAATVAEELGSVEENLVQDFLESVEKAELPNQVLKHTKIFVRKRLGIDFGVNELGVESIILRDYRVTSKVARKAEHLRRVKWMANQLAGLTDEQVAFLKKSPCKNVYWFDKYRGKMWDDCDYNGYAQQMYDWQINLSPKLLTPSMRQQKRFVRTFVHEVAHLINYKQINKSGAAARMEKIKFYKTGFSKIDEALPLEKRYCRKLPSRDMLFASSYGKTNHLEDFAEMISWRLWDPKGYKRYHSNGVRRTLRDERTDLYRVLGPEKAAEMLKVHEERVAYIESIVGKGE